MQDGKLTLGNKLKELRIKSGYRQKDVVIQCGISEDTLRKVENGVYYPRLETLMLLSNLYKINLTTLAFETTVSYHVYILYKQLDSISTVSNPIDVLNLLKQIRTEIQTEKQPDFLFRNEIVDFINFLESYFTLLNSTSTNFSDLVLKLEAYLEDHAINLSKLNKKELYVSPIKKRIMLLLANLYALQKDIEPSNNILNHLISDHVTNDLHVDVFSSTLRIKSYIALATNYHIIKKYNEVIHVCAEGIKECSKIDSIQFMYYFFLRCGVAKHQLNHEDSIHDLTKAMTLLEITNRNDELTKIKNILANSYQIII